MTFVTTLSKEDSAPNDDWPFTGDDLYHLILNIAVGGSWGGREGVDKSTYPQRMEVDYVRVFQRK